MLQFPTLFYPLSFLINTHESSTRTHSIIHDNPELTALFLIIARKEEISSLFESHDFFKDNLQSYFCFDVPIPALGLSPHAMLPSMPFFYSCVRVSLWSCIHLHFDTSEKIIDSSIHIQPSLIYLFCLLHTHYVKYFKDQH